MAGSAASLRAAAAAAEAGLPDDEEEGSIIESAAAMLLMHPAADRTEVPITALPLSARLEVSQLRSELLSIRELLSPESAANTL